MPDEDNDSLAYLWKVRLEGVQRLQSDDPNDHDEVYMVEFELESPSLNGSVEIMVGGDDEATMIARARDMLQAALGRWARVMARPLDDERIEPKDG